MELKKTQADHTVHPCQTGARRVQRKRAIMARKGRFTYARDAVALAMVHPLVPVAGALQRMALAHGGQLPQHVAMRKARNLRKTARRARAA